MYDVMSPCTGLCKLQLNYCLGCGRTLQEICAWNGLSDAEKLIILSRLKVVSK